MAAMAFVALGVASVLPARTGQGPPARGTVSVLVTGPPGPDSTLHTAVPWRPGTTPYPLPGHVFHAVTVTQPRFWHRQRG